MPALRLFGRRWHIAVDDTPLFALVGLTFHATWSAFVAAGLAIDSTSQCSADAWVYLRSYLAALLGVDTLMAGAMGGLMVVGLRGSILDTQKRASGPLFLYAITLLYFTLLGVQIYGSVMLSKMDCHTADRWNNPAFATTAFAFHWVAVAAYLATFVITYNMYPDNHDPDSWRRQCTCYGRLCCLDDSENTWFTQSTMLFTTTMRRTFTPRARGVTKAKARAVSALASLAAPEQQDMTSHSSDPLNQPLAGGTGGGTGPATPDGISHPESDRDRDRDKDGPLPHAGLSGVGYASVGHSSAGHSTAALLGLGVRGDGGDLPTRPSRKASGVMRLQQMADVFHMLMSHVDLTPSDYATGLMLLGILQRIRDSQQATANANAHADGLPGSPPLSDRGNVKDAAVKGSETVNEVDTDKVRRQERGAAAGRQLPPLRLSPDGPRFEVLRDCQYYFRHACAVYGWPMHLWMHKHKPHRCCAICQGCCACCQPRTNPFDMRRNITIEAIRTGTGMNPATDLLYISLINEVEGLLPYYVSLNRERKEVVISIRGSLSQRDVLTDFLVFPVRVDPDWIRPPTQTSFKTASNHTVTATTANGNGSMGRGGAGGAGSANHTEDAANTHGNSSIGRGRAGGADGAKGTGGGASEATANSRATPTANSANGHNSGGAAAEAQGTAETKADTKAGADAEMEDEFLAHQGALYCAYAVAEDLHRSGVLRAVMDCDEEARAQLKDPVYRQDCSDWKLMVIGHSLGAGVAALLAQHLRPKYPNLHCWAFSPPGGLMSPSVARAMKPYCTSVIIGKDMIPRLSLLSVMHMTEAMVVAAARCKVSKTGVWLRTMALNKRWTEDELFKPEVELDEEAKRTVLLLKQGVERSMPVDGIGRARDFQPPGKLLYYEKDVGQSRNRALTLFTPRWLDHDELLAKGMMVSRRMFNMHVPDFQATAVKQTLRRATAGLTAPAAPAPRVAPSTQPLETVI